MDYDQITHDTSALDEALRGSQERQRMAAMSALNRTRAGLLMSAVPATVVAGLALVGAASAAAWIMRPHFDFHDVVIDVPKPHEVTIDVPKLHEAPFDLPVPIKKPFDLPVPIEKPLVAPNPPAKPGAPNSPVAAHSPAMGPDSPYVAKTPEEKKFVAKPAYKDAAYRGRIVKSRDGHVLSFEDGKDFHPAHWDDAANKVVDDPDQTILSDPYVGDLGMCLRERVHTEMWACTAMHNGHEVRVSGDEDEPHADAAPHESKTPPVASMVSIDVRFGNDWWPVTAAVDTGCSWALSLPNSIVDVLLKRGLATPAGTRKSILADGSEHDTDVIVIDSITVAGHTLENVESAVSPSPIAPVLLGLAALNQLGSYKIENGQIVFTGGQPL
jgi:hypothetical protein